MNRFLLSLAMCVLGSVASAAPPANQRNFVACPILQDTKTVPCWLADHDGKRYYLGIQIDASAEFYPPHLGHKVLVEGQVTDEEICGGKVIKPIKISVLPELDATCNTMLPAVDAYTVPFAPRGPGPRAKLEELRARGARPPAAPATTEKLEPPYAAREFVVYYDFDSEIANRYVRELAAASNYAKAIKAQRIKIETYRASVALSDGSTLTEQDFLSGRRALRLEETFRALGFPPSAIKSVASKEAVSGTGVDDWRLRRSVITISP